MRDRIPRTGLLAASILLLWASPSIPWGWIGHRLITRQAIALLPPQVKSLYDGQEAALGKATVRPDELSATSQAEAIRHFLNPEVLDPSFATIFRDLPPPGERRSRHARETESDASGSARGSPARQDEQGRAARESAAARGAGDTTAHEGTATRADRSDDGREDTGAQAASGQGEQEHPPAGAAQERLEVFMGRAPFGPADADRIYALVPPSLDEAQRRLTPGQRAALGEVVYQPARWYAQLVRGMRLSDRALIVEATGRLSHYVGDLHQPLHNTIDHDGVLSSNMTMHGRKGPSHTVHQRFESDLLKFMGPPLEERVARALHAPTPRSTTDLTRQALAASREGYGLIARILDADKAVFAQLPTGGRIPWKKYNALAEPAMGPIAVRQLAAATQMLADLIVSAYAESRR